MIPIAMCIILCVLVFVLIVAAVIVRMKNIAYFMLTTKNIYILAKK